MSSISHSLCAVDFSESARHALAEETEAQLLVRHVVELPLAPPEWPDIDLLAMADRAAHEAVRRGQELVPASARRLRPMQAD